MQPRVGATLGLLSVCIAASVAPAIAAIDTIPLRTLLPNSRVAIWGDSITELTASSRFIETYLLACAGRHDVRVCTFGHSGEGIGGMISRQLDLEAFKPTVVTIHYGMNDAKYSPYTNQKGADFTRGVRAALAMLKDKGIKQAVVVGPSWVDGTFDQDNPTQFFGNVDAHGMTAAQGQNFTLDQFHKIGRAAAVESGAAYADIHNRMKDAYTAARDFYGVAEGGTVHPSPNGHLMIALEMLKALACDGEIAAINVDMNGPAHASDGHTIVSCSSGVVVLESSRYPFCYNYDLFVNTQPFSIQSILPYLPFSSELNRFTLKVTNLDAAAANVTWGSETKQFSKTDLLQGINLMEKFSQTPFDLPFSRVMKAVADKQDFEFYMIKGTSNYNGNDNGGNVDENMLRVYGEKDADLKKLIKPVRHTIVISPVGAPEAAAPIITGAMSTYATVGQPFSYRPLALHSPTKFDATELPAGLQINASTGEITGTPTRAAVKNITLTASNAIGATTAELTLSIEPPIPNRPDITSPTTATAITGQPFKYQIAATHSPICYFVTAPGNAGSEPPQSSLPPGLSYDAKTGVLSGTPSTTGVFAIQLAAMNDGGVSTALISLTLTKH